MELLFKREQTIGKMNRVNFKLWGKLEVTEDEQALINRYRFDESVLIGSDDSELMQKSIKLGAIVFVIAAALLTYMANGTLGFFGGIACGVIAENVRGLATWNDGMVLETVCADLEREGYEVQPFIIPACAVGAPHRRDRLWIIARAKGERDRGRSSHQCNLEERKLEPSESEGREIWRESIGRAEFPRFWEHDWREVALATCHDGMDDGLSRWMDGTAISPARHRRARLKACGNAIVPQVAMEIFRAIKSC